MYRIKNYPLQQVARLLSILYGQILALFNQSFGFKHVNAALLFLKT